MGITLDKNHSHLFDTENHRFQHHGAPLKEAHRVACLRFQDDSYEAISIAAEQGQDVAVSDVIDIDNEFSAPFLYSVASSWGRDVDLVSEDHDGHVLQLILFTKIFFRWQMNVFLRTE